MFFFPEPPKPIVRSASSQTSSEFCDINISKKNENVPYSKLIQKSKLAMGTIEHYNYTPPTHPTISTSKNSFNYQIPTVLYPISIDKVKDDNSYLRSIISEYKDDLESFSSQCMDDKCPKPQSIKSTINQRKSTHIKQKSIRSKYDEHAEKINVNSICHDCAQLKKVGASWDNVDDLSIYSINTTNIYSENDRKTTISEESITLSDCSLNESWQSSCDCQFKSITIKLGRPR